MTNISNTFYSLLPILWIFSAFFYVYYYMTFYSRKRKYRNLLPILVALCIFSILYFAVLGVVFLLILVLPTQIGIYLKLRKLGRKKSNSLGVDQK